MPFIPNSTSTVMLNLLFQANAIHALARIPHHLAALMLTAAMLLTMGSRATAENDLVLLKNGIIHTISRGVITNGQILIRKGLIAEVGSQLKAEGAQEIDLQGSFVYPGLIAPGTSMGLTEINAVRATRDVAEVGTYTPDVQSWIAVNPDSELLPVARANGITSFLPVPQGGTVTGESGLLAIDGWTTEQMLIQRGVAMHVFWPSMNLDLTPRERSRDRSKWKSPEDLARERRKDFETFENFFQDAKAYAAAKKSSTPPSPNPAWEAIIPYTSNQTNQRPLMIHADDLRQIKAAVAWSKTNDWKIIIAGGRDARLAASLLASNHIPVLFEHVMNRRTPDSVSVDWFFRTPSELHRAGVLFAISTGLGDMDETEIRNLAHHAAQAVAYGLPSDTAIQSITLNSAKILGVEDRLGSIEPGKFATLIATSGDLLDIRSNVRRCWIAGHEVSLANRHSRLYEKYRARPTPP